MKIALFGCNGQVGWELQRALRPLGELVLIDSQAAPLAAANVGDVVRRVLDAAQPEVIVNAAAYTAVDKAETDRDAAWSVNAHAPEAMARWAKAHEAHLVHYSTDYVFDGSGDHWRAEGEATAPANAYGQSKRDGEQAIADVGCAHWIFRTSWVFGHRGGNFARTIFSRAQTQPELKVVNDQHGAPTSAWLIADATALALQHAQSAAAANFEEKTKKRRLASSILSYKNNSDQGAVMGCPSGIYHLVASGACSWFDYAKLLVAQGRALRPELSWASVSAVPSSHYPTPAKRPANSRLSTAKGAQAFGWQLPDWRVDVERWVQTQGIASALQPKP
jgi:dTDP-4-dehydrorhamnose reductase